MFDQQALYKQLSDDLDRLIGPLFGFGEQQIRKRGQFLPYGATLFQSGEIGLEAATNGEEFESTIEVLPVLHDGLRARVKEGGIAAIAVCLFKQWLFDKRAQVSSCASVRLSHHHGFLSRRRVTKDIDLHCACQWSRTGSEGQLQVEHFARENKIWSGDLFDYR